MGIEFSEIQLEEIIKGMDKAVSVAALLENDLGTQRDIPSANAVCVIKDIVSSVRGMVAQTAGDGGSMENRNV